MLITLICAWPVKKDTAGIALSALGGRRGSWGDRGLRKGWCKLQSGAFRLPEVKNFLRSVQVKAKTLESMEFFRKTGCCTQRFIHRAVQQTVVLVNSVDQHSLLLARLFVSKHSFCPAIAFRSLLPSKTHRPFIMTTSVKIRINFV